MTRAQLEQAIQRARDSPGYANYLAARHHVLDMLDEQPRDGCSPSRYWQEELDALEYMLDAPPLVVERLRAHCHDLTGLRTYDYRRHHAHKAAPFLEKLASLRAIDHSDLFVPEPGVLGGFGHEVEGGFVNVDTLKFYECLIALDKAGVLGALREDDGKPRVVVEIGAGWGGFAYQLATHVPRLMYVIVDLPQVILFAATYLSTALPHVPVRFLTRGSTLRVDEKPAAGFVFMPHYLAGEVSLPRPDLAINVCSFQEMTGAELRAYASWLRRLGCPLLYSLNRDRSSHNNELTSVSDVLAESYDLEELSVLTVPYTTLGPASPQPSPPIAETRNAQEYRHLVGHADQLRA